MIFYEKMFRKYREHRCMTLEQIAKQTGVTKQTVGKWESGQRIPKPQNVYKLAKVLGISAVDISDLKPEDWLIDTDSPSTQSPQTSPTPQCFLEHCPAEPPVDRLLQYILEAWSEFDESAKGELVNLTARLVAQKTKGSQPDNNTLLEAK